MMLSGPNNSTAARGCFRIGQQKGADDDGRRPGVEMALDGSRIADAAAHLDGNALRRSGNQIEKAVVPRAVAGGGKIDQVQASSSCATIGLHDIAGIGREIGRPGKIALREPHDTAVQHVNGGNDLHVRPILHFNTHIYIFDADTIRHCCSKARRGMETDAQIRLPAKLQTFSASAVGDGIKPVANGSDFPQHGRIIGRWHLAEQSKGLAFGIGGIISILGPIPNCQKLSGFLALKLVAVPGPFNPQWVAVAVQDTSRFLD